MLNETELKKKLRNRAELFEMLCRQKEYLKATKLQINTSMAVLCLDLDKKFKTELFGTREAEEPVDGLFSEKKVIEASWECILKKLDPMDISYEEEREMWKKTERT